MKKNLNKKGFTLIELIVVIAILAILALILVPSITGYIAKADAAKNQANARSEYSRVVLELWTTSGAPKQRDGITAIPNGTASYPLTSSMACTATWTANTTTLTAFACTAASKTWSVANDFTTTP